MRRRIERHILRPGAVSCLGLLAACGGTGDTTTIGSASDTTSDVTGDTTSGTSTGEQGSDAGGEPDADTESEAFDDFVIDTPDGSGPVVVAALSESAADNSVALEQAFMAANNGGTLSIPAGTYAFTDNVNLSQGNNIIIEGNGARLVLTKGASLLVDNSSRLRFEDLILDWDWDSRPLAYFAVVESNTGSEIRLDFPLDATIPDAIDWWNVEMIDPATFAPVAGGTEWWQLSPALQQKTGAASLSISGFNGDLSAAVPGTALRIRQLANAQSDQHVWYLDNVSHTVFERVSIYSGSYMGYVLVNNTHHILLDDCRIVPDPEATGSKQILSTFADALHVGHFTGYLGVVNSEFSHQGDDALNIKQNVASRVTRAGDTTLYVETEQWFSPFEVGDTLELRYYADHGVIGVTPPVTNVQWAGNAVTLSFGSSLPAFTGPDVLAINERFNTGQYFIRNNHLHSNRARGILPRLPNGVIADNLIEESSMPGILFEFGRWDNTHAEGSFIDNLQIIDNTFVNTNLYGWYPSVITYRVNGVDYPDGSAFPQLFSNLTIRDNTL